VTRHPDAEVLADYQHFRSRKDAPRHLLGRFRRARVRAHLAGCAECSALEAGLAQVSELLASAPTPRMPDHLISRLENALAAEVAGRAGAAVTNGADGADGARDGASRAASVAGRARHDRARTGTGRPRVPRQWRPAVLGAAAAAAVIVAGGAYGLSRLGSQPTASPAASAQGRIAGARAPAPATGGSRQMGPVTPAAGPAQLAPLSAAQLHVIRSGTDYLPGQLARQVESVLAGRDAAGINMPARPAAGQVITAQLRACVTLITGGVPPRLVDVARYQGRPATVIVQAASAGAPQQVWVAGPRCSASQRDLIAQAELAAGS
jgi:hypothetical protein